MSVNAQQLERSIQYQQKKFLDHQRLELSLRNIMSIPEAYYGYLTEMARRRQFQEALKNKSIQVGELFEKIQTNENARLKLFKQSVASVLPPEFFPGVSDDQSLVTKVKVPEVNAPAIYSNTIQTQNSDLLASDFDAIFTDEKDLTELKKENLKLRGELAEKIRALSENKHIEMLEEIVKLKSQVSYSIDDRNQFISQYEERFDSFKAKNTQMEKELENKNKLLASNERQLKKFQDDVMKEFELRTSLEEKLEKMQKELETLKSKPSQDKSSSNVNEQKSNHTMKDIMETMARTLSSKEKELKEAQSDKDKITMEFEKLKLKVEPWLMECPFCAEFVDKKEIEEHVNDHMK